MERQVYKDCHVKPQKIGQLLAEAEPGSKILIVFWHGLGDTLMFLPLFDYVKAQFPALTFTLGLLPGVDQDMFLRRHWPVVAIPEAEFLNDYDAAMVVSFPMIEGADTMTKAEYCCEIEFGLPAKYFGLPDLAGPRRNRLVGLHLQGTCLPGNTNPDDVLARKIWHDLEEAGYIPIDLHFCHTFHNPVNQSFPWATRSCRDLKPDLGILQMMIERCFAVCAVASGPFVLAASVYPRRTIYLQKNHTVGCYLKDFKRVVDLNVYGGSKGAEEAERERQKLISMLWTIDEEA